MPVFGLIAEGPTDHAVLENILVGFFDDPDLIVRPLQPLLDATDASERHGGWTQVLAYCQSIRFQDAFVQNDCLVVQIDTDRLSEKPFSLDLKQPVETLVNQVIENMEAAIRNVFGDDFLHNYRTRLLFAVSVNEIECWLLPLFYTDKTASATNNCLYKLNKRLARQKERPINPENKNADSKRYDQLSRAFCKPKNLSVASGKNPSFNIFINSLGKAFPDREAGKYFSP